MVNRTSQISRSLLPTKDFNHLPEMTDPPPSRIILFLAIVFEGGLVGVAVLLGWLLGRPSLALVQPSWRGFLLGVAAAGPLIPVMLWCLHSEWGPLRRLVREVDETIAPYFAHISTLDVLIIALLAGLGEELLFRGVIQAALLETTGTAIALTVTSLLFGLLHLITPTYAFLAATFGLYLGGLMLTTGNVLVPIVAHAVYDVVAIGFLRERGRRGGEGLGTRKGGNRIDSTETLS